jgi:hypothetical protein
MGIDVRWVSRGREKLTTYYSIKKRYGQTLAVIISSATLLARGYN